MEFINKKVIIYKFENNGKVAYTMKVAKKKQDGTYENGFKPIRFKKDIDLKNRTEIIIKEGWEDFFTKDNKTYWYFFINKFELANELEAIKQVQDNQIFPKEKPYNEEPEELPFY